MPLLTPLMVVPAGAVLICLLVRSRRVMGVANVLGFGVTVALGVQLLRAVLANSSHVVTEWQ